VVERLQAGVKVEGIEVHFRHEREHRVLVALRGDGLDPRLSDSDPQVTGVAPLSVEPLDPEAKHTAELIAELDAQVRTVLAAEPKAHVVLLRGFDTHRELPTFAERYGLRAAAVAIYPMYRGIARLLGMDVIGRPADLTEQLGILRDSWGDYDYFFLHHKYTDSAGEDGDRPRKIKAIENLDAVIPDLRALGPDVIVVTGDHSTPSQMGAHSWRGADAAVERALRKRRVVEFGEKHCLWWTHPGHQDLIAFMLITPDASRSTAPDSGRVLPPTGVNRPDMRGWIDAGSCSGVLVRHVGFFRASRR
jgi:2,3-bisphosphoglycerate-independent phosphoglycerate mutase